MEKRNLNENEYQLYQIDSDWEAFEFYYSKVIEERCDQFEYELESEGYEVFNRDYIPIATSIYDFKLVVARPKN